MVQYVFTPWQDRQELLMVRDQFYDPETSTHSERTSGYASKHKRRQSQLHAGDMQSVEPSADRQSDEGGGETGEQMSEAQLRSRNQHQAVARVSMWMQRGNCPHMVESTALLMAALLSDESVATESAGSTTYAVRAAYSAAFSRFVTGLLDSHQDKQHKQSMYSIAKTIGLPATFVELRHQATHEQLPSLAKLRSAAKKALEWIWEYYWKHLSIEGGDESTGDAHGACRQAVLQYLRETDEVPKGKIVKKLRSWELGKVLKVVAELQETLPGNQVYLKCLILSREVMAGESKNDVAAVGGKREKETPKEAVGFVEGIEAGEKKDKSQDQDVDLGQRSTGWARYEGDWKPKPIGIV